MSLYYHIQMEMRKIQIVPPKTALNAFTLRQINLIIKCVALSRL